MNNQREPLKGQRQHQRVRDGSFKTHRQNSKTELCLLLLFPQCAQLLHSHNRPLPCPCSLLSTPTTWPNLRHKKQEKFFNFIRPAILFSQIFNKNWWASVIWTKLSDYDTFLILSKIKSRRSLLCFAISSRSVTVVAETNWFSLEFDLDFSLDFSLD